MLGTVYLPPGQFRTLLRRVTAAWQQNRAELEKAAAKAVEILQSGDPEIREPFFYASHVAVFARFVSDAR